MFPDKPTIYSVVATNRNKMRRENENCSPRDTASLPSSARVGGNETSPSTNRQENQGGFRSIVNPTGQLERIITGEEFPPVDGETFPAYDFDFDANRFRGGTPRSQDPGLQEAAGAGAGARSGSGADTPPRLITTRRTVENMSAPSSPTPSRRVQPYGTLTPPATPGGSARGGSVSWSSWVSDSRGMSSPREDLKGILSWGSGSDDSGDARGVLSFLYDCAGGQTTIAVEDDVSTKSASLAGSGSNIDDRTFHSAPASHASNDMMRSLAHSLNSITRGRGKYERLKDNGKHGERTGSRGEKSPCRSVPCLPFPDTDTVADSSATKDIPSLSTKSGVSPKPSHIVKKSQAIVPTDNDVLLGPDASYGSHPGNAAFGEKALEYGPWYRSMRSPRERRLVVDLLVESVRSGGHLFLERVAGGGGPWREAPREAARKEARWALTSAADGDGAPASASLSSQSWASWAEKSRSQDGAIEKLARVATDRKSRINCLNARLMEQSLECEERTRKLQDAMAERRSMEKELRKAKRQIDLLEECIEELLAATDEAKDRIFSDIDDAGARVKEKLMLESLRIGFAKCGKTKMSGME